MRSRVMPGSSPTMERRERVRRLKSVDLPTLGRPTMAKMGPESAVDGRMRDCLKRAFFKEVRRSEGYPWVRALRFNEADPVSTG